MVAEHYPRLGFEQRPAPVGATADATFWRYRLDTHQPTSHFIEVKDA